MSSLAGNKNVSNNNNNNIFGGDTSQTKVFVGGLAWETQKETMKNYFQQFGEILEAVVIYDKNTGRSKGYGFVTFQEAEAARKACVDPAPVIDGRRANCNLASLGVRRSRPSTPQLGGGKNLRVMKCYEQGGGVGTPAFHYAVQQGIPIPSAFYGYSPYSSNYTCPTTYYGACSSNYVVYGNANSSSFYPYNMQYGYPHFQYPIIASSAPHYASPISHSQPIGGTASVSAAVAAPPVTVAALAPHYVPQTNSLRPISSV